MAFSFIHIADIHLGRAFSGLSECSFDENAKNIYKNAVETAFNNFINFAINKNVDFILIAGDTFDNSEQDFKSKLTLKEGLLKLDKAGIKVFMVCGNHDPIPAYNKNTFNFEENSNIKIIGLNTAQYGSFPICDKNNNPIALLHAYSYNTNHIKENPIQYFQPAQLNEQNIFNIGLLHCDLDAEKNSPYAPVTKNQLIELHYDYWAIGHIHLPSNLENIGYSGTIQGRNSKETGIHGFKYIEAENNSIIVNEFIPADVIRFENINIDISSASDTTTAYEIIQEKLLEYTQNQNCKLFSLKITLEGSINFYSEITSDFFKTLAENIKSVSNHSIYISELINNTHPKIEEKLLFEDEGISGEIFRAIDEKNINTAIEDAKNEFKNLIKQCGFSPEELTDFELKIAQNVKDNCLNLANKVYFNEERSDV